MLWPMSYERGSLYAYRVTCGCGWGCQCWGWF